MTGAAVSLCDVENTGKKKVPADENLTKSADDTPYNDSEGGV